jgi:cyclase
MTKLMPVSDRRTFIKSTAAAALGTVLAGSVTSALGKSRAAEIHITSIGEGLDLIEGAGGNVVLLKGAEGLLLIDGGSLERAAELQKTLSRHTGKQPVRVMFNTHWHWDHTGSNERAAKSGAQIVAHENTKLWLAGDFYVEWEKRAYKPRPKEALPTQTFLDGKQIFSFGNEQITYDHLPRAHTDGDIYVSLPSRNVLVVGDLLSVGRYPISDYETGGWIGGLLDATKALLDVSDAQTRIVPGTGPVQTRADLQAQHDMLATLKDRLVGMMKKGMSADDMLAASATKEFDAKWGDPTLFVSNAYRGLWGHRFSLGGIV